METRTLFEQINELRYANTTNPYEALNEFQSNGGDFGGKTMVDDEEDTTAAEEPLEEPIESEEGGDITDPEDMEAEADDANLPITDKEGMGGEDMPIEEPLPIEPEAGLDAAIDLADSDEGLSTLGGLAAGVTGSAM